MAVAEQRMDFSQDGKQHYATRLSPKKEMNPVEKHEKYGFTCADIRTSEETVSSMSGEDVEVDVEESDDNTDLRLTEAEDPDATEYSSSFADTASDADMCNGLSEAEVESYFYDNGRIGPAYDAFNSIFHLRKKRLTGHWRNFIQPLMWRCKWTELRIKEIESRSLEYSRELEAYDQAKLGTIDPSMLEMCGTKSLPFSNPCYGKRAAKRRKRKKVEDTNDIMSYLSHHNLFSYIENKRLSSDGLALADDFAAKDLRVDTKNQIDLDDDQSLLEHGDGDCVLEQVLWKIEMAHSQVHKLKGQLDVLMSKNAARFSSSENLSLLAASSAPSPTVSAGTGDVMSVGAMYDSAQHLSEYVIGDIFFPESAISSYDEAFHVPDIIESTVGLLSAADVTLHQPEIGDSCEDIMDNVLMQNEAAEVMKPTFVERSHYLPSGKIYETDRSEEGEGTSMPSRFLQKKQDQGGKSVARHEKSVLSSCLATELHVPRNKRTKGERKGNSWCKKHPNDPESH